MNFVDDVVLEIAAGDGGDGLVHFRRERFRPRGGPDGGDGGDGGSVIFKPTGRKQTLAHLAGLNKIKADSGANGGQNRRSGKSGLDKVVEVPRGTLIKDEISQKELFDLVQEESEHNIAQGGKGGRGNWHFKSSTNRSPQQFEEGVKGEKRRIRLVLKLIADVGLVGLPNAGKSTLLNALTRAQAKVAAYPFTTTDPNLGVLKARGRDIVLADIPGLISGAAEGKGLGHDFLRHLERTKIILHLIPADSPDWSETYQQIRAEMTAYSQPLAEIPEQVIISKIDLLSADEQKIRAKKIAQEIGQKPILISAFSQIGLEDLRRKLLQLTSKS